MLIAAALAACAPDGGATPDGGAGSDGGAAPALPGLELLPRLAGLWSGPATGTPLGAFPVLNMDLRAATDRVLFGRADLDERNSLRFAFSVEDQGGPVLVFRNGGLFQGVLRDSRTRLLSAAPDELRFCALEPAGCGYIDARFQLGGDQLALEVKVKGAAHLRWQATRREARPLPAPFPADGRPVSTGDGPFPPLPSLRTTVTWDTPLGRDASVWVLLSQSDCTLGGCAVSRSIGKAVPAGARSAEVLQEQLHGGGYRALVVLDRNGNLAATLRPDSGDGLSLPNQPVTVAPAGESALAARILYDLP